MLKPRFRDYECASGMHAAMRVYARSLDKTSLDVTVLYNDGSTFFEQFEPATKEVTYRVLHEDETYEETVDVGNKWQADWLVPYGLELYEIMGKKQLVKAFADWLNPKDVKKVTWSRVT